MHFLVTSVSACKSYCDYVLQIPLTLETLSLFFGYYHLAWEVLDNSQSTGHGVGI